jgi:tetratricopeptide (TPR) repeat protein
MDCRISSAFLMASLTLGSGCVATQTTQGPTHTQDPPPQGVALKESKTPKRPPLPGTVVALAVIKEREAEKTQDAAQRIKMYDEARLYFQEALQIDPKYRDAVQGLARVYTRMDDFDHALAIYQKALDKNPKDHGLWFDMGMCWSRKRELARAIPCFQKALELDPENRQYMTTLGLTLARLGQTDQGLALLTRSMGAALAHYNVARMMEHLGQSEPCRQQLELALQLNPNLEQARGMLEALQAPRAAQMVRPSLAFKGD